MFFRVIEKMFGADGISHLPRNIIFPLIISPLDHLEHIITFDVQVFGFHIFNGYQLVIINQKLKQRLLLCRQAEILKGLKFTILH